MRNIILRLVALYVIMMGIATGIHVILTPAIYTDIESAPIAWLIMNPMNCAAALLMLALTVVRKIQYDRARSEGGGTDSVIEHIDTNVPVYVAAVLSVLYPVNTLHEIANPGSSILAIWYYLDAGMAALGIAVGVRILRASGLRVSFTEEPSSD